VEADDAGDDRAARAVDDLGSGRNGGGSEIAQGDDFAVGNDKGLIHAGGSARTVNDADVSDG